MIVKSKLSDSYIDLLKKSLLNFPYIENEAKLVWILQEALAKRNIDFLALSNADNYAAIIDVLESVKRSGDTIVLSEVNNSGETIRRSDLRNITELSHTMIGEARMENIRQCVEIVLAEGVPGDLIETGIWRGGAVIFMRGILKAYGIEDRIVWAADSFDGVPKPTWAEDVNFDISKDVLPVLAVTLDEVKGYFEKYDLLDEKVEFLEGWFKDTLSTDKIEKLAVLRLDGDLYESTMDALNPLYGKVSSGGFIIVDDYESCHPCKAAITDFRGKHNIVEPLQRIDGHAVFWRKG
jgi:hypothetical protein